MLTVPSYAPLANIVLSLDNARHRGYQSNKWSNHNIDLQHPTLVFCLAAIPSFSCTWESWKTKDVIMCDISTLEEFQEFISWPMNDDFSNITVNSHSTMESVDFCEENSYIENDWLFHHYIAYCCQEGKRQLKCFSVDWHSPYKISNSGTLYFHRHQLNNECNPKLLLNWNQWNGPQPLMFSEATTH